MINSITNITQIYATSKVAKTTAISAYSDVSSAKPLSRMEQMNEKYKDIYSPMPSTYSKEIELTIEHKVADKYPKLYEKYNTVIKSSIISQNEDNTIYKEDKQERQKLMNSLNITEEEMLNIANFKNEL